jgi:hypothetical protein
MTTFEQISGLKTNKEKSKATPINCSVEDLQTVSDTFGCAVEAFPCCYLGVPLSITRLCRSDEQPIIDAVSSCIPTWKGNLLNMAGRSTLVAATLSAIPVYISIALCSVLCVRVSVFWSISAGVLRRFIHIKRADMT